MLATKPPVSRSSGFLRPAKATPIVKMSDRGNPWPVLGFDAKACDGHSMEIGRLTGSLPSPTEAHRVVNHRALLNRERESFLSEFRGPMTTPGVASGPYFDRAIAP